MNNLTQLSVGIIAKSDFLTLMIMSLQLNINISDFMYVIPFPFLQVHRKYVSS